MRRRVRKKGSGVQHPFETEKVASDGKRSLEEELPCEGREGKVQGSQEQMLHAIHGAVTVMYDEQRTQMDQHTHSIRDFIEILRDYRDQTQRQLRESKKVSVYLALISGQLEAVIALLRQERKEREDV